MKDLFVNDYETELSQVVKNIISGKDTSIIVQEIKAFSRLFQEFLEDSIYTLKFFKNHFYSYRFILVSEYTNIDLINHSIVNIFNKNYSTKFSDINELIDYLDKNLLHLIIVFEKKVDLNVNYLLSNKFTFRGNLYFIEISKGKGLFESQVHFSFTNEFLNKIIRNLSEKYNIPISSEKKLKIFENFNIYEKFLFFPATEQTLNQIQADYTSPKIEQKAPVENLPDLQYRNTKENILQKPNLTDREEKVYKYLLEMNFITRQKIVDLAWGKNIKVTDDAIDQFISRLRKKFVNSGYVKDYIFVEKGKGVRINIYNQQF